MRSNIVSRMRSCDPKRAYQRPEQAQGIVKQMQRAEHTQLIGVYRCKHCGAYHIGHRRAE